MIQANDINEDKYPNSRAVIGYENVLTNTNWNQGELQPNTYEGLDSIYDEEFSEFIISADSPTSSTIDYFAMLVRSKAGAPTAVNLSFFLSGGGTAVYDVSIVNGIAFLRLDDSVSIDYVDIKIDGSTTGANDGDIKVLYIATGIALEMTQPIYGGHSPSQLNKDTTFTTNKTANGNFIGRTIENQYSAPEYSWRFLDGQWYRDNFIPFRNHALTKPFFIQWRPDYHPEEVSFCWTTDDIKATNAGQGTTLINATMSAECYSVV